MSPPRKLGKFEYKKIGEVIVCDYYYDFTRNEWILVSAEPKPLYIAIRVLEQFNSVTYWSV